MQYLMLIFVLIAYGLVNYYIGLRGFQSINAQIPINRVIYWIIIFLFASMFIASMAGRNYLPEKLRSVFYTLGGYWLVAIVYLLGFVIIIDIFRTLAGKLNILPDFLRNNSWFIAFSVVAIVSVLLAIGTYNAVFPKVVTYDINIDKKAGSMTQLKVAMISDAHLGENIGKDRLHRAVLAINDLKPDITVIAGDLIDMEIESIKRTNMLSELKSIKSKYGVYAILGNHEYYGKKTDEITRLLEDNGVTVLRDRYVKVQNSFYLVGREDRSSAMNGYHRLSLDSLLKKVDKSLPVIVLDHQPSGLDEARKQGVDLQLSGHTHAGQFFPISLVTKLMYEEDNGYLKDDKFNLVVSSGFGTWGPTVRIGSQSQVVNINISFRK